MSDSRLRIVVGGMVACFPVGGVAWDYLQYPIGLARLGHDVCYHEDTERWPFDPQVNAITDDPSYPVAFLGRFFERYAPELSRRWHYRHLGIESHGMTAGQFRRFAASADLFLNVSGGQPVPPDLSPHCRTAFLDTDPGYNQILLEEEFDWAGDRDWWCSHVGGHDVRFTYAENIHGPDCKVPRAGMTWRTTRMPVVIDLWADLAAQDPPPGSPWTTVMTWNAFPGPLVHHGVEYGSKGREFEKILELPRRSARRFSVAVGGKRVPGEELRIAGWRVLDGPTVTATPEDYRRFLGASRGEISTAKQVYVALRSGWFSCRSACYLAAGRPVVVQDTGFPASLPTGEGILCFSDLDEARRAIESVEADYPRHRRAARERCAEHFGAQRVLSALVEESFASEPSTQEASGDA